MVKKRLIKTPADEGKEEKTFNGVFSVCVEFSRHVSFKIWTLCAQNMLSVLHKKHDHHPSTFITHYTMVWLLTVSERLTIATVVCRQPLSKSKLKKSKKYI